MKFWYARVSAGNDAYGVWKPTGETDKDKAIEYAKHPANAWHVKEWLLL